MNIGTMNDLTYVFKMRGTGTEAAFLEDIKTGFKKVFEANNYQIFVDLIQTNPNLLLSDSLGFDNNDFNNLTLFRSNISRLIIK